MMAEITGIGWITATGAGCAKDGKRFSMGPGELPPLTAQALFNESYAPFRRMDEYSKLGLGAIAFALKDAGLDRWSAKRNIGIIAATTYGCLGADLDYYDTVMTSQGTGASPAVFSYTLPSIFLGEAAIRFGLTGTTFVIHEADPLGVGSLKLALAAIARGEADSMLCGVCNHYRPQGFEESREIPAGALFILLEAPPVRGPVYGKAALNARGQVELDQQTVTDFSELVQRCLSRSYRGARPSMKEDHT